MSPQSRAGRLFVVSTPIGNMGDFSFRAVETLASVAAILAEDTRHSRRLLDRYDIHTPVVSYHEHNEAAMTPRLLARLRGGEDLALISDAGTPLLSDPGARLVQAAVEAGVDITPVPGASALLSALVATGMDATRFTFFGFLPRKGRERSAAMDEIVGSRYTAVVYEAANRVDDTLSELEGHGAGARPAAVARELTKQFEEVRRGTVSELLAYYKESPPRGEVVIVIAGAPDRALSEELVRDRARALRASGLSVRDVTTALVLELGASRNMAYRAAREAE